MNTSAARDLVRSYHAGDASITDTMLDRALGLDPATLTSSDEEDEQLRQQLAKRGVGPTLESLVNVTTPYEICRALFQRLELNTNDTFVDWGSGAGRVILYGALCTDASFVGIELSSDRAEASRARARRLGTERVHIHCGNVLDSPFLDGTVMFAFRPFSESTQAKVMDAVANEARRARSRPMTLALYRMPPPVPDPGLFDADELGSLRVYRRRDSVDPSAFERFERRNAN